MKRVSEIQAWQHNVYLSTAQADKAVDEDQPLPAQTASSIGIYTKCEQLAQSIKGVIEKTSTHGTAALVSAGNATSGCIGKRFKPKLQALKDDETTDNLSKSHGPIKNGVSINNKDTTTFIWAVLWNNLAVCDFYLNAGRVSPLDPDPHGTRALIHAAKAGNPALCALILRHTATEEVDHLDPSLHSALYYATLRNHLRTCQVLLSFGASAGSIPGSSTTALHTSALKGHDILITLFLAVGTDIEVQDGLGLTPLHIAVMNENVATAKLLLNHGADVNAKSEGNKGPLAFATTTYNVLMVWLLLERGANPHMEDVGGWSPWKGVMLAESAGKGETWRLRRLESMRELMEKN